MDLYDEGGAFPNETGATSVDTNVNGGRSDEGSTNWSRCYRAIVSMGICDVYIYFNESEQCGQDRRHHAEYAGPACLIVSRQAKQRLSPVTRKVLSLPIRLPQI